MVKGYWNKWETSWFNGYDQHGKMRFHKGHYFTCSECGRRTIIETNFCPDCGTDMRGDTNGK